MHTSGFVVCLRDEVGMTLRAASASHARCHIVSTAVLKPRAPAECGFSARVVFHSVDVTGC